MGLAHEAEAELGPYSLDCLVKNESQPRPAPPVVIEVDGATHFFNNVEATATATAGQGRAPRGQTALKRRWVGERLRMCLLRSVCLLTDHHDTPRHPTTFMPCRILHALTERGVFACAVVITTDEWAAAAAGSGGDEKGRKRALLSAKLAAAWGEKGCV